ncbi:hypothetical protein PTTG_10042 [Puccinia triticina 1-1 BBBD Race 1]|uniref:Small ribosomal subunit protein mS29 n=2 Tax=Puccinia triticina TaxID=208348 RepID=A0A180GJL9_PUCT1|nr:uncharacterized protein PtA15_2A838 [Puccinia triticina]OAV92649.1 hypothetical protein PTTG_10042 [Puccinia triticina 1-1 BBBD Race 1]WAQ82521.1 hypothetical protein PtA15_2A838 [Puccinia triticina]WAR53372.1 hypothetical protein PtB15_2B803 [Puccinia triticina]
MQRVDEGACVSARLSLPPRCSCRNQPDREPPAKMSSSKARPLIFHLIQHRRPSTPTHPLTASPYTPFTPSLRFKSSASAGGSRTPIKLKINKKDGDSTPRPGPDPGQLVNLDYITQPPINLASVPDLEPSKMTMENVGKSYKFSARMVKAIDCFSIPSSIAKDWKPMSVPVTTLRKASVELISRLVQARKSETDKPNVHTLNGQAGTGKSVSLLHALSYAVQNRWIVLYIPDAKCVVDGQYSYEYCPRTETYHQNSLSAEILRKLVAVNDLEGLTLTKARKLFGTKDERTVDYEEEIASGTALSKFAQLGIQQIHLAPNVLEIVFEELARQTVKPVFFAIDGAQNLFKPSDYVDGSFRQIDSFAFNVARLFLNFARGTQKWSKGLTILTASSLHCPSKSLAWDRLIKDRQPSIVDRSAWPGWEHYQELIKPVQAYPNLDVNNLDRVEALGVAQALELSRLVLAPLDDRVFLRHLICSNGNVREFTREIKNQIKL